MSPPDPIPVIVIGAGPVGLTCSILLSLSHIPHVLVSKYPTTSIHPKTMGLNQLSMEIFRTCGVAPQILAQCAPADRATRTAWYTSLGPRGKEIASRDILGGGQFAEEYKTHSALPYTILAQIRLEPILLRRARGLNPEGIQLGKEVVGIVEDGVEYAFSDGKYSRGPAEAKNADADTVTLRLRHRSTNAIEHLTARYVLGADGGRMLADMLDIPWDGERDLVPLVSAHIRAPLTTHHPDPRNFLTWFINPHLGGSISTGVLYQGGPWGYPNSAPPEDAAPEHNPKPAPEDEEWIFVCALGPDEPPSFDKATMLARLAAVLQVPDMPDPEILSISHWSLNARVARHYRSLTSSKNEQTNGTSCCNGSSSSSSRRRGRLILVGDAAHKVPPWGALGMNTGVQDALNLVWKLARVLRGTSDERILESYERERKPVATRVAEGSLRSMRAHAGRIDAALGVVPGNTVEENVRAMEDSFDPGSKDYAAKREAVDRAQRALDIEFKAPGMEVGWFYPVVDEVDEGAASGHDGQILKDGSFDVLNYHPSTIPGHVLPHVWLRKGEKVISSRAAVPVDKLLLVTDAPGLEGVDPGNVEVFKIGGGDGWVDVEKCMWEKCKFGPGCAILVRPDGIVAWREVGGDVQQLRKRVGRAVERILCSAS